VPSLRSNHVFLTTWDLVQTISHRVKTKSGRAAIAALNVAADVGMIGFVLQLLTLFLYEDQIARLQYKFEILWMNLADRKDLLSKIASYLLYRPVAGRAITNRWSLVPYSIVLAVAAFFVAYLFALFIQ
jgi:hypothetical protein